MTLNSLDTLLDLFNFSLTQLSNQQIAWQQFNAFRVCLHNDCIKSGNVFQLHFEKMQRYQYKSLFTQICKNV